MVSDPRSLTVLGIESSCDETAAAVVRDGREVLSSVIVSQVEAHAVYGGVVPEIAGRSHLEAIGPTVERALAEAGLTEDELSGLAVTTRPGLVGSLLVGASYAKGLAYSRGLPLVGVHHIEAHVYAAAMDLDEPPWPCLALVVSGGHTALYRADSPLSLTLLAATLDDAAGEAFDKAARVLGLGFPGGPAIQKAAESSVGKEPGFTRPKVKDSLDFSFSGLKTAVLRRAEDKGWYPPQEGRVPNAAKVSDVSSEFQEAIVDTLATRTVEAVEKYRVNALIVGGGVASNTLLRKELTRRSPVPVVVPRPALCTDNGAMIGAAGWFHLRNGPAHQWEMDVEPRLKLG